MKPKTLEGIDASARMQITALAELKREAIKWIKELRGSLDSDNEGFYCLGGKHSILDDELFESYCEYTDITGTIKWIKCFFNISEEELK